MTRPNWYSISAKAAENRAEVLIYDEIGMWGVTAKEFVDEINALEVQNIDLRLNTPGGSVFDGNAIYNALKRHPAAITTHIDGLAASMGSIIALAGDEVRMAENALYMIHNPWTLAIGDAEELRATAGVLDKLRDGIVATYRNRTGETDETIIAAMDAETWFTAEEAKAFGFVDEITGKKEAKATASIKAAMARFKNAPEIAPVGEQGPEISALSAPEDEVEKHDMANAAFRRRQQVNEWAAL